jgi:hypothetical protein
VNADIEELYANITISRKEFLNDLKTATENKIGYSAGKIGLTAHYMLLYEVILNAAAQDTQRIEDYEKGLEINCLKQQGIFPVDYNFYRYYIQFYAGHMRNIDCLGLCLGLSQYPDEFIIIDYYKLKNKFIHFVDQEPDRSVPSNDENCYLHYFRDKKILLICPFAEVLKKRATKEIFEGVWSKTGKKWFYPKQVESLEFPYGFSRETHKEYASVIDLFEYIKTEIDKRDFEIALIAAAGLAIPIASYIKNTGKIAIDLGGHLQIIFGVLGKRWRNWEDWKRDYFNDYWIDMPAKYRPKETDVCDQGAYW